jgi:hypothetical protein
MNSKVSKLDAALFEIQNLPKSKGRRYSAEHQSTIAKAFAAGMSVFEIHRATGIPIVTLRNWRKKSLEEHFVAIQSEPELLASKPGSVGKIMLYVGDHLRLEISIDDLTPNLFNRLKNAV